MLLFIGRRYELTVTPRVFQNISCYCLSVTLDSSHKSHIHFKTSHVIVYPPAGTIILRSSAYFKTSHVIVYLQPPDQQHSFHHHFKTSHVIVYPDALESYKRTLDHFKTSHVIVYHFRHRLIPTFRLISKHLMLLFI